MSIKKTGLQLHGGASTAPARSRRRLDYYPTPEEVTVALLDFLKMPPETKIWEPACGENAMVRVMQAKGYDVTGTDIITGSDYLKTPVDMISETIGGHTGIGAIITNPPFNLSELFIEKAVSEAPIVAMLLKSQYWHAAGRLKLFKKIPPRYVCPLTWRPDFYEAERGRLRTNISPTMEVIWTVWKGWYWETDTNRITEYCPLRKPGGKLNQQKIEF